MGQEQIEMERMTPEDVARDFEGLKGLSDVALGLGLLSAVLVAWATQTRDWGPFIAPIVGTVVLSLVLSWSQKWYATRVGSARSKTFSGRTLFEVVGVVIGLLVLFAALGVDLLEPSTPVLVFPALCALLVTMVMRRSLARVGLTPVHLGAVVLMLLAALSPLVLPLDGALPRAVVGCGAVGLAMLATGITDHLRLMRALRVPGEDDHDAALPA